LQAMAVSVSYDPHYSIKSNYYFSIVNEYFM
jgi:hypothetical protein